MHLLTYLIDFVIIPVLLTIRPTLRKSVFISICGIQYTRIKNY